MSVVDWGLLVGQYFSLSKSTRGVRLRPLFGRQIVTSDQPKATTMRGTAQTPGGVDQDGIGVNFVGRPDRVTALLEVKRNIHLLFQGVLLFFSFSCLGQFRSNKERR